MTRVFTGYGYTARQLHTLLCECVAIPDTSFIIKEWENARTARDYTMHFVVLFPRARPGYNTMNSKYNTMIFLVHTIATSMIHHNTTKFRGIIPYFFLRAERAFSAYINPSQQIDQEASDVTELRNIDGELFIHDKKVNSIPLNDALLESCQFLNSTTSNLWLLIVAHITTSNASRSFRAIQKCFMLSTFYFVAVYVPA